MPCPLKRNQHVNSMSIETRKFSFEEQPFCGFQALSFEPNKWTRLVEEGVRLLATIPGYRIDSLIAFANKGAILVKIQ
jgi:hypothetical protein